METFQLLNQTNTQNYSTGLSWLQNQPLDITEYLSERVHLLLISGADSDLLVSYYNELFNAWGGFNDGYKANNYDTALALQALTKINYHDQIMLNSAVNYLLGTQNSDGGWGFRQEDDSEVYYTALISTILQQFPQTTTTATAINKATSFLLAHQNTDGGFGPSTGSGSTVYETSLAYLTLVGVTTDATVLGSAINYLTSSTQLSDGSWDEDSQKNHKKTLDNAGGGGNV
jgi:prenyltransferase beta subunit